MAEPYQTTDRAPKGGADAAKLPSRAAVPLEFKDPAKLKPDSAIPEGSRFAVSPAEYVDALGQAIKVDHPGKKLVPDLGVPYELVGLRGTIDHVEGRPGIIETETGGAVIASPNQPIFTKEIDGCSGLFVRTPTRNMIFHLVMASHEGLLSWNVKGRTTAIDRIMETLGAERSSAQAVYFSNVSPADEKDRTSMVADLKAAGLTNLTRVDLRLENSTLAFHPDTPNVLYIAGNPGPIGFKKVDGEYQPVDDPKGVANLTKYFTVPLRR